MARNQLKETEFFVNMTRDVFAMYFALRGRCLLRDGIQGILVFYPSGRVGYGFGG